MKKNIKFIDFYSKNGDHVSSNTSFIKSFINSLETQNEYKFFYYCDASSKNLTLGWLKNINLLCEKKDFKNNVFLKVRSTGKLVEAKVSFNDNFSAKVNLVDMESGISPGQACVFYKNDSLGYRVLGGGWITE